MDDQTYIEDDEAMVITDDESQLSANSHEQASAVWNEWSMIEDNLMQIDQELGSNFLDADIFDPSLSSPTGPLEELVFSTDTVDRFSLSLLTDCQHDDDDDDDESYNDAYSETSSLTFQARYEATIRKLQESMKRSQETRASLNMKTSVLSSNYARRSSVSNILLDIERSSEKVRGLMNELPLMA
jgi:hypothetical protein